MANTVGPLVKTTIAPEGHHMDVRGILDQLFRSGEAMLREGRDAISAGTGRPAEGAERPARMSGAAKGALAAGVFGLLLGTKTGRSLGSSALKLGGLAALGGLAYRSYKDWQAAQTTLPPHEPGQPVGDLDNGSAQARAGAILRAMIAAARADGHVDEAEQARIDDAITRLGLAEGALATLRLELSRPIDPQAIANLADTAEAATEIYLASAIVIGAQSAMERAYLDQLREALRLAPDLAHRLETAAGSAPQAD